MGNLIKGGIDNIFYDTNDDGTASPFTVWRFQGYVTYTIGALTSLQRDRLFDELCRVFAFSGESAEIYQFRNYIENNPYIAMNINFDDISMRGGAETQGTPWGSNDILYEITVAMECVGEFRSDRLSDPMYLVSEVIITATDPFGGTRTTTVE